MTESYVADLVDFAADREEELKMVFINQLLEENDDFSIDFDDHSL
jgi:hypothetical protein